MLMTDRQIDVVSSDNATSMQRDVQRRTYSQCFGSSYEWSLAEGVHVYACLGQSISLLQSMLISFSYPSDKRKSRLQPNMENIRLYYSNPGDKMYRLDINIRLYSSNCGDKMYRLRYKYKALLL